VRTLAHHDGLSELATRERPGMRRAKPFAHWTATATGC